MEDRAEVKETVVEKPSRRPDITLDQVEAFCAVAEAPSYRQAALDLLPHQSPESSHVWLIRRIDRLEEYLGKKLVEGTPRGDVRVTSVGRQLLPAARLLRDAARALKNTSPDVRLSAYPAIATRLLMHDHAQQLFEGEPALTLYDVTERHRSDRGRSILNRTALGEIDLAIAPSDSKRTDLAIELAETILYDWTLQVVLPGDVDDRLLGRRRIRVREIADLKIVCAPEGHRSRELLERAFDDEGLKLEPYAELSNQDVLHRLARQVASVVAVLPNDAFASAAPLGPDLASGKQKGYGDSYSLYHRRPFDWRNPTEREQLVSQFAMSIAEVFLPEKKDLVSDLKTQTQKRRSKAS